MATYLGLIHHLSTAPILSPFLPANSLTPPTALSTLPPSPETPETPPSPPLPTDSESSVFPAAD